MPRERKPARLWLKPERRDAKGRISHEAVWLIKDGEFKRSTSCGVRDRAGAEKALHDYLVAQRATAPVRKGRTAEDISIAEVLLYYTQARSGSVASADELGRRIEQLLGYWGGMNLDAIDTVTCQRYVDHRAPSLGSARRELEDLRAACNLAIKNKILKGELINVELPPKPGSRKDFLERDAAAALIWHAYRKKETQTITRGPRKGEKIETSRRPTRHIARFILFGLYTGTRSKRIWQASFYREEGRPWIDVDAGVYYREAPGETASETKRAPSIRLPKRLIAHLRRWRDGGHDPKKASRYLCSYRGDKPCDPKKAFARLVDDVMGDEGKSIVRHSLRHTAATWLLLAAEDPHAIAGYLGMRTDVLIKVYGHHHPEYQEEIGDAFSSGRAGRVRRIGKTTVGETGAVSVAVPDVAEIAVPKTSTKLGT